MEQEKQQLILLWLIKAKRDLIGAEKLGKEPDSLLDIAIFHCQQASEKAIKSYLILHDQFEENTHNLGFLIREAAKHSPELLSKMTIARSLTGYNTDFRYPYSFDDELTPSPKEFQQALKNANEIYQAIEKLMPQEIVEQIQQQIMRQEAIEIATAVREMLKNYGTVNPDSSITFESASWRFAQQPGDIITITVKSDSREILRVESGKHIVFKPKPKERAKLKMFRQDIANDLENKQQNQPQQRRRGRSL